MDARTLIQVVNGVERPAPGRWPIGPGQSVWRPPGVGGQRPARVGRTLGGALVADTATVRLELDLLLDGATRSTIKYRGIADLTTPAAATGDWPVDGALVVDGRPTRQSGAVRYHGVFRIGTGAATWLAWRIRVRPEVLSIHPRAVRFLPILRHRPLSLRADLTATSPTHGSRS